MTSMDHPADNFRFHPKKHFGQNFLKDRGVLQKIVGAGNLQADDTVLEIGSGKGILTIELAKRVKHVISIEKDRDLIPLLSSTIKQFNNVTIIQTDALRFDPPQTPYKIVANIPYYITSPLINHFLKDQFLPCKNEAPPRSSLQPPTYLSSEVRPVLRSASEGGRTKEDNLQPAIIVLLTQKEVAQKICAIPPDMNILALNIQIFGQPQIIDFVSKNAFSPVPKVDSAIIKITPYEKPIVNCDLNKFFTLIHAAFNQKRKTLLNSLKNNLKLSSETLNQTFDQLKIDGSRRPETFTLKEWESLTNSLLLQATS